MAGSADEYSVQLARWLKERKVNAELFTFGVSCHSVPEAAAAAGVGIDDLIKSICFRDRDGSLTVAIVKGEDRVDRKRVGAAVGAKSLRIASPEEILAGTGYPCGGTPPFGFSARFVMDERVFGKEVVYAGGGCATALVRATPEELQRVNGALRADIRVESDGNG